MPDLGYHRRLSLVGVIVLIAFFAASAVATPSGTAPEPDLNQRLTIGAFGSGFDGSVQVRDGRGDLVWQRHNASTYSSVVRLGEGRLLVGFAEAADPRDRTGVRIIDWRDNSTVWQWTMPVETQRNSEIHDAEPLPNGNILVADMHHERILIVNRTTKAVEWQWNASSFYEAPADPTATDWLHINDVDRIGGGRYLVSVRNTNQLLIITRARGVVEVINEDRSRETLYQQHNPQWLGDGRVLVADSENDRVVELAKHPSGEWRAVWEATHAAGVRFDWPRDADRLPNGNTLITDTRNNRVVAVDESGDAVWSVRAPRQSYEADTRNEVPRGPANPVRRVRDLQQPFDGIGFAYSAIRSQVPLPRWVGEWQLLALIAGLGWVGFCEAARVAR